MFLSVPSASLFGLITISISHDPPFPRLLHLSKEIYPRFLLLMDRRMSDFLFLLSGRKGTVEEEAGLPPKYFCQETAKKLLDIWQLPREYWADPEEGCDTITSF